VQAILVNGVSHQPRLHEHRSLLELLREDLRLTGAKPACGEGACGACTVVLDGEPVRACVTPATAAAGRSVTTIEGLASEERLVALQQAFVEEGAVQCGYCTAGMVMAAAALLARNHDPAGSQIRAAMSGNVCRCGAYHRIERAISRAARAGREGEAGSRRAGARPAPRVDFSDFRPRAPWDLVRSEQREYFELLGDGLMVVLAPAQRRRGQRGFAMEGGGAWLHVAADSGVTAFTGKVDVGQDNRTALSMIVADELGADLGSVLLVMGDTDICPADPGTFGSRSLPDAGEDLRLCAASARELLASRGHPGPGDRWVEPAAVDAPPLPRSSWRYRGRPAARLTAEERVTGAHRFPSDLTRPGMLHGCVLRAPAYGAVLESVQCERARSLPGVTVVHEGDFVGVAASDQRSSRQALEAIDAQWTIIEQAGEEELVDHLRSHPVEVLGWEGGVRTEEGDPERAIAAADVRLEATYTCAYIAHASPETRVALAEWKGERLTVWTGAQQPFFVRYCVAASLDIPEEQVRVIVPDLGGGFGSKHTEEVAIAAARLARHAGEPVRVALSREEEFRFTYSRPAAVIDVRSGARTDGTIAGWDFANVNSGAAALSPPYAIADQRISFQPADSPLPQGPYRALAATANNFARESQVDELAHALALDPLEVRLHNLRDERLAAVLRAAAHRANWEELRRHPADGLGIGIACGMEKGGRVATCALVRLQDDLLEVLRVTTAFECGAIVNSDNLECQVEGATVMGLGGALFEAVHFSAGRILNASMQDYRVPRFGDAPPIEVVLLDRPEIAPAGGGETPIIAVAPALANAVFAAGGQRIRSLPLLDAGGLRLRRCCADRR